MLICDLRKSDLSAVRTLLRQLGYETARTEIAGRIDDVVAATDHHAVIAVEDGKAIGLLHVYVRPALEKPREAVVQALVVDKGHRGQGVGERLMQAAETWARTHGLEAVVLHARSDRTDAQDFYARLGYETAATSNFMRKSLKES